MGRRHRRVLRHVADLPLTTRARAPWLIGLASAVGAFALLQHVAFGLQQDDPYHLALAELIAAGEHVRALPWAKHTVLATRFADMHFGYHLFVAPFVALAGSPLGGSIATTASVAVLALVLAMIAGREHPLRAVLPALVLFGSSDFLLRVMGMRPIAWGAAATLVVLPLAHTRRHAWLVVVGALFAWSYAAFPLLALPLIAHAAAHATISRALPWKPTASVATGVLLGVLAHPDFPAYLDVLRVQLFDVSRNVDGLNLEYAAPSLDALLTRNGLVFVALALGTYATARAWPEAGDDKETLLAWALFAVLALGLAMKYVRGVDTFVPATIAYAAIALGHARDRVLVSGARLSVLGALCVAVFAVNARSVWAQTRAFEAIDAAPAAAFLARTSAPGDEVFLVDYGAFPRLFHANRRNVYTLGLDPAFMRAHDPELFAAYLAAVRLEMDPYPLLGRLGARYVYVENTAQGRPFYAYLRSHGALYRPVYQDRFAAVFLVRAR